MTAGNMQNVIKKDIQRAIRVKRIKNIAHIGSGKIRVIRGPDFGETAKPANRRLQS